MKNKIYRAVFLECLRKSTATILIISVFSACFLVVTVLYHLPFEPFGYGLILALIAAGILFAIDYRVQLQNAEIRAQQLSNMKNGELRFSPTKSLCEKDYAEMISVLGAQLEEQIAKAMQSRQDMQDYYTAWVHQIKTPIAVMKLHLTQDTDEHQALRNELFRIEQYVEMVLAYIRLGSDTNDLVVREYDLDESVRESIRKFAPQFIAKKIKMDYNPCKISVITDKKWLGVIIDQLLSNAVKYTPSGTVSVYSEDGRLSIKDTGIGIAAEDLPRIFERGYTGNNGRIGEKSSGLGLYLAKSAADKLDIDLSVESAVGIGTVFSLDFSKEQILLK